jgi:lipoprotein-anchoring transpeptidase ErfK/SrfK
MTPPPIFSDLLVPSSSMRAAYRACLAVIAGAALAGFLLGPAGAGKRPEKSIEIVQSRAAGPPIMAVVSLGKQQITIYDADGWIMRAPVSSGRKGYETPAGIYSVLQKEVEHYSNLYEDGYMPFMQRITWSGIALHGGPLPGYPASHGCVRMPVEFAERLYDLTKLGLRVIVAPGDPLGADISHRFLSRLDPSQVAGETQTDAAIPFDVGALPSRKPVQNLLSIAAAKAREAEAAARRAGAARLDSVKKTLENSRITAALNLAESAKSRLEARASAARAALEAADTPEAKQAAQEAKERADAKLGEAQARYDAALAAAQHRPDVVRARELAETAAAESTAAAQAATEAARKARPVSIFISRKTQQLYVRQSFQPIFAAAVTIQDSDQPIGTHIFTALKYAGDGPDMRWNVISMDARMKEEGPAASRYGVAHPGVPSPPKSAQRADAALERIMIAREDLDRVAELVVPGSSLIVSDEAMSLETGHNTDFVVIMSGEPQGALVRRRHHSPDGFFRYGRPFGIFWR